MFIILSAVLMTGIDFFLSCWMCSSDLEALIEQVFEARVV